MIRTDLGCVTAYADAVAHGYTGTREEFGEVLANFADSAEQVAQDRKTVTQIKKDVIDMQSDVTTKKNAAEEAATLAENAKKSAMESAEKAESARSDAITAKEHIDTVVSDFDTHVVTKITEVDEHIKNSTDSSINAVTVQEKKSIQNVKDSTSAYITEQEQAAKNSISNHTTAKIQEFNDSANTAKTALDKSIADSAIAKTALEESTANSTVAKATLDKTIANGTAKNTELTETIDSANTAKTALDGAALTGNQALQSLQSENASASSNLEELKSENFNSQEILSGVADLRAYLGLTADDILGLQVDYKNKTFKRLAGAANLTPGADFDKFTMYGGRRKCNVADDGTINAWYGGEGYVEDGSNGQVMVYQPKFYYLVCPVEYDPIDTGIGYHLRKANYYVSEKSRPGFRLHPAFYDADGNEIDYFLTSADEGSVYDTSASAYLLQDEQVLNAAEDKFCSIAGARPASGYSQNLTRTSVEQMAQNRGANWHGDLIKQVSAEQLLMIIEMGVMQLQTPIGSGVVNLPWETGDNKACSYAAVTGSTSSLGNGTGRATKSTAYPGNVATDYTDNGRTSICWRGKENFWGNLWKFVYGVNIWGNGKMAGGQPYICKDFNFAENKNSDNYEAAGFTVTSKSGYISAMGYSTKYDWLFMASECLGNSALPVGDYTYITELLNGYRIAQLGGRWSNGVIAGAFCWYLTDGVGIRYRSIGGRLVYIPTRDSDAYLAAIASWKEQMAA